MDRRAATMDRTWDDRFQIPDSYVSAKEDSYNNNNTYLKTTNNKNTFTEKKGSLQNDTP